MFKFKHIQVATRLFVIIYNSTACSTKLASKKLIQQAQFEKSWNQFEFLHKMAYMSTTIHFSLQDSYFFDDFLILLVLFSRTALNTV